MNQEDFRKLISSSQEPSSKPSVEYRDRAQERRTGESVTKESILNQLRQLQSQDEPPQTQEDDFVPESADSREILSSLDKERDTDMSTLQFHSSLARSIFTKAMNLTKPSMIPHRRKDICTYFTWNLPQSDKEMTSDLPMVEKRKINVSSYF
jgi:hypothetical protein